MKDYEEIARSVLERVRKEKLRKKRIHRVMISVAACFSVVVVAVLAATQLRRTGDDHPGQVTVSGMPKLSVFSVSAAEYKTMIKDVQVPSGLMHVRSVKGCTELERVFIRREEMSLVEEFIKDSWRSSCSRREKDNAIFVMGLSETLMIVPENMDQVSDFSVCAKDGSAVSAAVNPNKDQNTDAFYKGIEIWWQPPDAQLNMLLYEPETKLSTINDTITATVKFNDGSTETVVIDVCVDDAGYIYMTYRGAK